MGLFSSSVANITIDYYGPKKRHKVPADIQVYYNVSFITSQMTPQGLADLFSRVFIQISDVLVMPVDWDVFWSYVNDCFSQIPYNPQTLFIVWQDMVNILPLPGQPGGKPVATIKVDLMDNGKTKYKVTEGTVTAYYNALAPVAIMQTIRGMLDPAQFAAFYQRFSELLLTEKQTSKRPTILEYERFNLQPLQPLAQNTTLATPPTATVTAPPTGTYTATQTATASSAVAPSYDNHFCGKCGAPLQGANAAFCGKCGNPVA